MVPTLVKNSKLFYVYTCKMYTYTEMGRTQICSCFLQSIIPLHGDSQAAMGTLAPLKAKSSPRHNNRLLNVWNDSVMAAYLGALFSLGNKS